MLRAAAGDLAKPTAAPAHMARFLRQDFFQNLANAVVLLAGGRVAQGVDVG